MSLDLHNLDDGSQIPLGCLVPQSFPTGFPTFADTFAPEMMTLDQVRMALLVRNGASMWGRREKFAGQKYIRNQRNHGSCNGFSTAGALSRTRELRGEPYVCLSGADAYSQMNGNRDQGSTLEDGMKVVTGGIAPESLVPWDMIYSSQIPSSAKAERSRYAGFTVYAADEEAEIATALVLGRIVVVAVHAGNAFNGQDGDGVNNGGTGKGNHSVLLQDIRMKSDGTLLYDLGNSWDISWCSGGYTWVSWRQHLEQPSRYHRDWVMVSTTDDPKDSSEPPKV